jgi:hypothetical protein
VGHEDLLVGADSAVAADFVRGVDTGGQSAAALAFGEEVDDVPVPPDAGAGVVEVLAGAGGVVEPPPSVAGVAAAGLDDAGAVAAVRLSVL